MKHKPYLLLLTKDRKILRQVKKILAEHYTIFEEQKPSGLFSTLHCYTIAYIVIDPRGFKPLSLVHEIRQYPELKEVPVLFLTNRLKKGALLKAQAIGVNGFIPLNFTLDLVEKRLHDAKQKLSGLNKTKAVMGKIAISAPPSIIEEDESFWKEGAIVKIEGARQNNQTLYLLFFELKNLPQLEATLLPNELEEYLKQSEMEINQTLDDQVMQKERGTFVSIELGKNLQQMDKLAEKIYTRLSKLSSKQKALWSIGIKELSKKEQSIREEKDLLGVFDKYASQLQKKKSGLNHLKIQE